MGRGYDFSRKIVPHLVNTINIILIILFKNIYYFEIRKLMLTYVLTVYQLKVITKRYHVSMIILV